MNDLAILNGHFQTTFQKCREQGQINDTFWKRAHQVSIHSLKTGVCILHCSEPKEVKYRQIPQKMLHKLRTAVERMEQDAITQNLQKIVRKIAEDPSRFHPVFTVVTCADLLDLSDCIFAPFRERYEEDENNIPQNPFKLMDVVKINQEVSDLPPNPKEYHLLIKEANGSGIDQYVKLFNTHSAEKVSLYNDVLVQLQKALKNGSISKLPQSADGTGQEGLSFEFSSTFLEQFKEILDDEDSFFLHFLEFYSKKLSKDPNVSQLFVKCIKDFADEVQYKQLTTKKRRGGM